MGRVRKEMAAWGKRHLKNPEPRAVLTELHQKRKLSQKQIADMFEAPLPSVRYWLMKYKMLRDDERRTFPSVIQRQGYDNVRDFFTHPDNVSKTIKQLAEDTGFCAVTVSQWYSRFLKAKRKGRK